MEHPAQGTFNLHGSLLPQYQGAAPINHAVINGETVSGVTTFLIDEAIDTGNILLRREEPVSFTDTAGSLHDRLMALGAKTVVETVDLLMQGKPTVIPRRYIRGSRRSASSRAQVVSAKPASSRPRHSPSSYIIRYAACRPIRYAFIVLDFGEGEVQEIKVFETAVREGVSGDLGESSHRRKNVPEF